jgi:hypothetical protein
MELSNWIGAGCLITGVIQSWGAILQQRDRRELRKQMEAEGKMNPVKLPSTVVSLLLAIGAALTLLFAGWMLFAHPLRPQIVNVPQIVEKTIPCPPSKTGSVTQKGNGNAGNTGNGSGANAGVPNPPSTQPH